MKNFHQENPPYEKPAFENCPLPSKNSIGTHTKSNAVKRNNKLDLSLSNGTSLVNLLKVSTNM